MIPLCTSFPGGRDAALYGSQDGCRHILDTLQGWSEASHVVSCVINAVPERSSPTVGDEVTSLCLALKSSRFLHLVQPVSEALP
jgi:hypothetical protein